jgi:hypothetical protein
MSGDERSQFLEWHEEQKDKIFLNMEEVLAYCYPFTEAGILCFSEIVFEIGHFCHIQTSY